MAIKQNTQLGEENSDVWEVHRQDDWMTNVICGNIRNVSYIVEFGAIFNHDVSTKCENARWLTNMIKHPSDNVGNNPVKGNAPKWIKG